MSISRLLLAFATASTVVSAAVAQTATPPSRWGVGDELGMANTLGPATWQRCAQALANPKAKSYEVSHLRSNTMPQSPFGVPLLDRKSTRLNSSHANISYAVFCLQTQNTNR